MLVTARNRSNEIETERFVDQNKNLIQRKHLSTVSILKSYLDTRMIDNPFFIFGKKLIKNTFDTTVLRTLCGSNLKQILWHLTLSHITRVYRDMKKNNTCNTCSVRSKINRSEKKFETNVPYAVFIENHFTST